MTAVTEQELDKRTSHPRVTLDAVNQNIKEVHYFNVGESMGLTGTPMNLITQCILVLQNGYTVIGKSACASPENYIKDVGERCAYADAVSQIWGLMAYELKSKLASESGSYLDRLKKERSEVATRLEKLRLFFGSKMYLGFDLKNQGIFRDQEEVMAQYVAILDKRIAAGEAA